MWHTTSHHVDTYNFGISNVCQIVDHIHQVCWFIVMLLPCFQENYLTVFGYNRSDIDLLHLFLFSGETDTWCLPFREVGFNLDWVISNLVVLQYTVCFGWTKLIFSVFILYAWFCVLLKSMGESFLLSEDEPRTPNIDGVMALWNFRRRAQTAKNLRKLDH